MEVFFRRMDFKNSRVINLAMIPDNIQETLDSVHPFKNHFFKRLTKFLEVKVDMELLEDYLPTIEIELNSDTLRFRPQAINCLFMWFIQKS